MTIFVRGMKALGDCIFQRPYIRELCNTSGIVYVETPWPQLYSDMDVRCVRAQTKLRRSTKNADEQPALTWSQPPKNATKEIRVNVSSRGPAYMSKSFGIEQPLMPDLPPFKSGWTNKTGKPLAVVRPVTKRREWNSESRDPLSGYICKAARELMETHFVILVGDLKDGEEELVGHLPPHNLEFMDGHLTFEQFIGFMLDADVLVSGVGSFIPIALATNKRALVIMGGHGYQNGLDCLIGSDWAHQITFLQPKPFCGCNGNHLCNKVISDFDERLAGFIGAL